MPMVCGDCTEITGAAATVTAMLAAEAVLLMETHRITSLIVVGTDDVLVGALNVHDLLRAGVV